MDFLELAQSRFSVRSFKSQPVSAEQIRLILEAGRAAPTACNKQPQKILAVQSADGLEKLKRCTDCHFNAPLAFIVCHDASLCWTRPFDNKSSGDIDASIVASHMMLEAASLGIGSTWVMYFMPDAVKTEFELPPATVPTAILVMGYPADGCSPSRLHASRKDIAETVSFR